MERPAPGATNVSFDGEITGLLAAIPSKSG